MVGDAVDLGLEVDVVGDVAVDVVVVVVVVVLEVVLEVLVEVLVVLVVEEAVVEEVVEAVEEVVVVVVVVVDDGGADADAFSPLHLPPVLLDRLGGLVDNLVPCVKPALQRRLRMLLQDQEQLAQGREIANATMTNSIVTSYKQGGAPSVQTSSSRVSP